MFLESNIFYGYNPPKLLDEPQIYINGTNLKKNMCHFECC